MAQCTARTFGVVLVAVLTGVVMRSIQLRNKKAAHLNDTTPFFDSGRHHFVSLLQQQADTPQSSSNSTDLGKVIREAVQSHHGHLGYLGRCVHMVKSTSQFSLPSCDAVAHTTWEQLAHFEAFRQELNQKFAVHLVQGFDRQILINVVMAALTHGVVPAVLRAKAALFGNEYELIETDKEPTTEGVRYPRAEMRATADVLGGGDADEPMLFWSWEGEAGESNRKYAMNVMPLLSSNGAGAMHGGPVRHDVASKDGTFVQIVAYYYPSRRMASAFFRSDHLFEVIQDKDPGDGLVVATVPLQ